MIVVGVIGFDSSVSSFIGDLTTHMYIRFIEKGIYQGLSFWEKPLPASYLYIKGQVVESTIGAMLASTTSLTVESLSTKTDPPPLLAGEEGG